MTFVKIIVFLTLASLLFTISDVSKIKKENKKLKGEIEEIKKQILK
ncbi:hypothetical protein [Siminovitchia fordii]|uniref:Uncharacterized protein n=1 Tax=Siminovitchia fordii TaxID=254759 RepID=A0ABQ4KEK1_9BACI|nr:hypothetical protein [Siminovitchia fordii]GIN23293.1 hypothetical protein J1TS3_44270 [Siminovitchia fordii]